MFTQTVDPDATLFNSHMSDGKQIFWTFDSASFNETGAIMICIFVV